MPKSSFIPPLHGNPKDQSGYIYIFSLGYGDLYKIGKAKNWNRRLKTFQASNPNMTKILVVHVSNRHAAETIAHEIVSLKRTKREIFKLSTIDIELIKKRLENI